MAKRVESPSSINTFKQCKRKYYYQYIEKLPTIPNVHQVRGNIAHACLENFFDLDVTEFTDENYEQKFREAIQRLLLHYWRSAKPELDLVKLSNDQEKFYFEETMLMLMNWTNQFIEKIGETMREENVSVQEAFVEHTPIREQEYKSDIYSVHGFIDAIHQIKDEVHLIDYKTNSQLDFKDSIKLQLAIYSLLYFEKHGQKPHKVGISFLRHRPKMMIVDEELLNLAKREIELIHGHTSKTEHLDDYPRTVSSLCKWNGGQCDFHDTCQPHGEKK